jgi:hypothetical protein
VAGKRSRLGLVLAGGVVIAAGFAVALVELLHFPKGTIWLVVVTAGALVAAIRRLMR